MIDFQRQQAMTIARLNKKLEELTRRVETLEGVSDSSRTPGVSKLSPQRIRKLKDSVTQS